MTRFQGNYRHSKENGNRKVFFCILSMVLVCVGTELHADSPLWVTQTEPPQQDSPPSPTIPQDAPTIAAPEEDAELDDGADTSDDSSEVSTTAEENDESDDADEEDELDDEFSAKEEVEVFDPLSGYNRVMTDVNDWFYTWVLDPVARGYAWVLPQGVRLGVSRFFHNLLFPVRFINNGLQLKFKNAGEEFARFGLNSTIGILGFWDPAKAWFDLRPHEEDFGQTLGYYGVGGGFHIVLPFLGPSNLRDTFSLYPDFRLDPTSTIEDDKEAFAVVSWSTVNKTSLRLGEYESLKKDALDVYPFFRDVYEQNRKKQIEE